jgi:hypothetical protein
MSWNKQYEYKNNMYSHCKDMQKRTQMQHNYTEMCLAKGMFQMISVPKLITFGVLLVVAMAYLSMYSARKCCASSAVQ